jgi:hypothetical protein
MDALSLVLFFILGFKKLSFYWPSTIQINFMFEKNPKIGGKEGPHPPTPFHSEAESGTRLRPTMLCVQVGK